MMVHFSKPRPCRACWIDSQVRRPDSSRSIQSAGRRGGSTRGPIPGFVIAVVVGMPADEQSLNAAGAEQFGSRQGSRRESGDSACRSATSIPPQEQTCSHGRTAGGLEKDRTLRSVDHPEVEAQNAGGPGTRPGWPRTSYANPLPPSLWTAAL